MPPKPRPGGAYMLKNLDPRSWEAFRDRAHAELRPMRAVLLRLIELYTRHGLEAIERGLKESR